MNWLRRLGRGLWWLIKLLMKALLVTALVAGLLWVSFQGWHLWKEHKQGELVEVKLTSLNQHVTEEDLRVLLRPQLGLGFWQLDLPMIRQLIETHPWVAQAEVSRFWPNSLHVDVVEQMPVARWGDKGLLNQLGEIFTPDTLSDVDVSSLIQLSAVNPEPREVLTMLTSLLHRINPYGLHVEKLHRQADGSWHVWLVGGEEWLLPAQQGLAAVDQLLLLYGSIPKQENGNMRIDLRYRDGFAVKWQTKAAEPAP